MNKIYIIYSSNEVLGNEEEELLKKIIVYNESKWVIAKEAFFLGKLRLNKKVVKK